MELNITAVHFSLIWEYKLDSNKVSLSEYFTLAKYEANGKWHMEFKISVLGRNSILKGK